MNHQLSRTPGIVDIWIGSDLLDNIYYFDMSRYAWLFGMGLQELDDSRVLLRLANIFEVCLKLNLYLGELICGTVIIQKDLLIL